MKKKGFIKMNDTLKDICCVKKINNENNNLNKDKFLISLKNLPKTGLVAIIKFCKTIIRGE